MSAFIDSARDLIASHPLWALAAALMPVIIWTAKVLGEQYLRNWLNNRTQKTAHLDAKLWCINSTDYEFQFTLRNSGQSLAKLREIEILRPRGVKVAWLTKPMKNLPSISHLGSSGLTNIHEVVLDVEPAQKATVSMVARLPRPSEKSLKLKAILYLEGKKRPIILTRTLLLAAAIPYPKR